MTDALDAVIDGAIERALLGGDDARRYFALAGALDRGRSATRSDAVGPYRHDDPDRERPTERDRPTHVLGAALLSTVAVDALGSVRPTDIDPSAWSPGGRDGGARTELVAVGAAVACRRFDVDPETAAARSGVSPERLARHREELAPGSGN